MGLSFIKPTNINDHIATANTLLESSTSIIKSAPEIALSLYLRPMNNYQIIYARAGYMWIIRSYDFSIAETDTSPTVKGYLNGTIKETYTAYPFSLGAGMVIADPDAQILLEFIFGFGYITEEGNFTSSSCQKITYSRSMYSTSYGGRIAGQTTIHFSKKIGITLELGYRLLVFNDYQDEKTTQPVNT